MKNKEKIIFLSQVAGEIVFELSEKISLDVAETIFITGSNYKKKSNKLTIIKAPKYNNKTYFSRFYTWVFYFIFVMFKLFNIKGKPLLVISSNPPFLPLVGFLFNKFFHWNYIIRVLDVYPDAIYQKNIISKNNLIYKLWTKVNLLVYKRAKYVISLGQIMAKRVEQYLSLGNNVKVIPDWVNTEKFSPIPKDENWFFLKYFSHAELNVVYAGNLGLTHDVKTLFSGIESLQSHKGITFTIIGGGAHKSIAIQKANLFTNLNYLPYQSESALPYVLSSADVSIICMGKESEGISMPSKLYFSMASGSAILSISNSNNDLADIVSNSSCGINIINEDIEGFKNAILKFYNNKEFLKTCQANSRDLSLKSYSSDIIIPQYIAILNDAILDK